MRKALWRARKGTVLLAVALVAAGLGTLVFRTGLLRRLEQQTVDARFQIRGSEPRKVSRFVLVLLDSATLNYMRNHDVRGLNLPRRYDARVIERIHRAGARVIAYDEQFTEATDEADDDALVEAVGSAHHVVLATTEVGPGGSTDVLGSERVLHSVGARAGDAEIRTDSDGVLRNMQYSILGLRTFGVVVAEAYRRRPVAPSSFGGPVHPVPIDYAGPPGTVPSISYSRVYSGAFPARLFAGKIVVIGASAPTLQDLHETPTSGATLMAGPEVQANMAATVLDGIPLRRPSELVTILLIALLAALPCLAGLRLGTLGVALAGVGLLALWSVAAQISFDSGKLLDYSDPTASLLLASGGTVLVGLWADSRERRRLRSLFAADDRAVVEDVLRSSGTRAVGPTAIIAGYRIEGVIGRGGMGVVYRATQLALERPVAIKLLATERSEDPTFRARFELESRLAASIEHVNVIPVYEAGDDEGLLFIAMRLVDGSDLADVLARDGWLDLERTARLGAQLASALDAAHAHGLVHRDVKPANVLLTRDSPEHVYLTDFGVAKGIEVGDSLTRAGQWVGTLDYLAPEQIRGEAAGGSADIYALAGVIFHCLTGQVPFPRDNEAAKLWAHVNAPPPRASSLRSDLPHAVDDVIERGLAKEPEARYPSGAALAQALAKALGVTPIVVEAGRTESPDAVRGSELSPGATTPTTVSE